MPVTRLLKSDVGRGASFGFAVLLLTPFAAAARGEDLSGAATLRRPVALVAQGERLLVANRHSGSVSVIDTARRVVLAETRAASRLEDLVAVGDGRRLLAVDGGAHELILLERDADRLIVKERLPVPWGPVTVRAAEDGHTCSVASLWSRRLTLVDIKHHTGAAGSRLGLPLLRVRRTIDLPLAPREQTFIDGGRLLVVADAFAGELAVIETTTGRVRLRLNVPGHNIRGLLADDRRRGLHVAQQLLNSHIDTTENRIFWGSVIGNVLRTIDYDELLVDSGSSGDKLPPLVPLAHWSLFTLGRPSEGGADPAGIALDTGGAVYVALGGVGQVAVRPSPGGAVLKQTSGRRPTALALSRSGRELYAANTFEDSISVLSVPELQRAGKIRLGPTRPLTEIERGEQLFYDARLSLDGWYSCHSCHSDGHTTGQLNDNLGDGTFGYPKRIPSLLGAGRSGPWGWQGDKPQLAVQITTSIKTTMHGPEHRASAENVALIARYLESLPPAPGVDAARGAASVEAAARGRDVFITAGCADCHARPAYTTPDVYDVGIHDGSGRREFNPPSLLGVSQRGPLFHDARAASLRAALLEHNHGDAAALEAADLESLLAFLRSL